MKSHYHRDFSAVTGSRQPMGKAVGHMKLMILLNVFRDSFYFAVFTGH